MKIKFYSLVMIVSLSLGASLAVASDNGDRERQLELEKNRERSDAFKFVATNLPLVVRGLPLFGKALAWTGSVLAVETYSQLREVELERRYASSIRNLPTQNSPTLLSSAMPQSALTLKVPCSSKQLDHLKPRSESFCVDLNGRSLKPVVAFQDPADEQKIKPPSTSVVVTYNPEDGCVIAGYPECIKISAEKAHQFANGLLVAGKVTCNEEPTHIMFCSSEMNVNERCYVWDGVPPMVSRTAIL